MSCHSSGVLQPFGLAEAALLQTAKLLSSQQFDVRWANAELRTAELLSRVQPNGHSESQRKAVADYVSALVQECLNCEVFRFGSVPLKTYLPDGDIDLTAFSSHQELKESWALDVQTILEQEVQRKDAKFTVSSVQCIHAEVKLVKCVVENVVVDISFNQLGGLCTLCFLEEVDRLIQKNHLFKRSILLVKAWCYYESRILGAHHALISTYALETLVLYIFNVFHSRLRGPLEVLFTFLDYFSKFDWENFCVSLWGPVPLASLPDLTALPPLKDGSNLLLSKGFLEECSALYDVFPKGGDTQARTFSGKYLNIVDPLRINNNLGRSVSQANYHRIKSAFHLGARQLAKVFDVIDEDFPKYLDKFFSNTWERHQSGHRPDAPTSLFPPYEKFVYKTGYFEMPNDDRAHCWSSTPELEKPTLLSSKKSIKDEQSSSKTLHLGTLMEGTRMETAEQKFVRDPFMQESTLRNGHCGISNMTSQIGSLMPKTSANKQSVLVCNLPSAVSTDSQLRTSALRNSSLEEFQSVASMNTHKAPASLARQSSEGPLEKSPDTDTIKTCGPPETISQDEVRESQLNKDKQWSCDTDCGPAEGLQGAGMLRGWKSSTCVPDFPVSKEAGDTLAATHRQSSGKVAFMRGKSWPSFNRRENIKRSGANSFASNSTSACCSSSTVEDLRVIDTVMQKPDFLLPESRDPLYVTNIPSNLPLYSSSSSPSVMGSSPFSSAFPEVDLHTRDSARVSSVPATLKMPFGFSQGPTSKDVKSIAGLGGPINSQTPSQGQIPKEHQQPFHFLQQPDHAWLSSNEAWEHNVVYPFSSNNRATEHPEAQRSNYASPIESKASFTRCRSVPSDVQEAARTVGTDGKVHLSRQEHYDTLLLSRSKGDSYQGSEAITFTSPVLESDITSDTSTHSEVPRLLNNTNLMASCEELPIWAPCRPTMPKTAEGMSNASIPCSNDGFSCVPAAVQRPSNIPDTSQSALFGMSMAKASPGGKPIAQGSASLSAPIGAIPMISYYNPFYPPFPVNDFTQHTPYHNNMFMNGVPRTSLPPHTYHGPREKPESTAAALSARFASLSAEESAMEPQRDLLRSDLANHLRNLEFGRWCQEPVLQPLPEPPFMSHGSQNAYLWGFSPFMPLHNSSNQTLGNLKGPVPVLFSIQNVGGMPHIASCPCTSEIGHLYKEEIGTGTTLPVRNSMYRDLPLQAASQRDQGPLQKKTHVPSITPTSAVPALISSPVCHDAYNGVRNTQAFVNDDSEHGALGSDFLSQAPGRVLPFVAGQLEFGSLGPIEIVSLPYTHMGARQPSRNDTDGTGFSPFLPLSEVRGNNKAFPGEKPSEGS